MIEVAQWFGAGVVPVIAAMGLGYYVRLTLGVVLSDDEPVS